MLLMCSGVGMINGFLVPEEKINALCSGESEFDYFWEFYEFNF